MDTDAFVFTSVNNAMPRIQFYEYEPLSIVGYVILLTYIESIEYKYIVSAWGQHNKKFSFMDISE